MTEIYQIFYEEKQKARLLPYAIPYFNEGLTIFFENTPISDIVKASSAEKVAVCSWKLIEKLQFPKKLTPEKLNSDYHVLSFTTNSKNHRMLAMANVWHKSFLSTITLLWGKLGYKLPLEAKHPIYQNAYASKIEIYRDYVINFLDPAMELVEKDEELREKMLQPSGYGKLNRQADLKSVKAKLGLEEYPLCPFILERSPSLWFTMKQIPVTYL